MSAPVEPKRGGAGRRRPPRGRRPGSARASRSQMRRSGRAVGPTLFVALGLVGCAALAIAGRGTDGLAVLGVCLAVALGLGLAPVRGDLGARIGAHDEPERMVELRAAWYAAQAMAAAVIVALVVQVARGGHPGPYVIVGLAAAVGYGAGLIRSRRRA